MNFLGPGGLEPDLLTQLTAHIELPAVIIECQSDVVILTDIAERAGIDLQAL